MTSSFGSRTPSKSCENDPIFGQTRWVMVVPLLRWSTPKYWHHVDWGMLPFGLRQYVPQSCDTGMAFRHKPAWSHCFHQLANDMHPGLCFAMSDDSVWWWEHHIWVNCWTTIHIWCGTTLSWYVLSPICDLRSQLVLVPTHSLCLKWCELLYPLF